jgi:hypothetical protein
MAGQRAGRSRSFRAAGQALVIVQIALAAGLTVVATSLSASLARLLCTDLGLRPSGVLTFTVVPSRAQYSNGPAVRAFTDDVLRRLARISTSEYAAASWNTPVGEPYSVRICLPNTRHVEIQYRPVTAAYFRIMSIPLLRGRGFTDLDGSTAEPVAIVNRLFASRYLPGEPLGQHIELLDSINGPARIVGVVGNTKQSGPDAPCEPIVYLPFAQVPDGLVAEMREFLGLHFFVQTGNSSGAAPAARQILREIAPEQVVTMLGTLTAEIGMLTADQQTDLKLVGTMTLFAVLVANGGLYSVVSISVASRKRDYGIRAALGAAPRALAFDVLGSTAGQIGTGLAIGAVAGLLASRYVRSMVAGFEAAPFLATASALGLLFCTGVLTCLVPALQAARVNPTVALREE